MQHTWLIALMIIFLLLLIGFIVFLGRRWRGDLS
jgi:hypothetical protein